MIDRDPLCLWIDFGAAMRQRLEQGRKTYGDRSFQRPPAELLAEIQEELLDIAGWGFIAWTRLEELKNSLQRCAEPLAPTTSAAPDAQTHAPSTQGGPETRDPGGEGGGECRPTGPQA